MVKAIALFFTCQPYIVADPAEYHNIYDFFGLLQIPDGCRDGLLTYREHRPMRQCLNAPPNLDIFGKSGCSGIFLITGNVSDGLWGAGTLTVFDPELRPKEARPSQAAGLALAVAVQQMADSLRWMSAFGWAPTIWSTLLPSLNNSMVGIL